MATSIKISQLPAKGSALEATDLLEVSEFNGTGYVTKSITGAEIVASVPPTTVEWGDIGGTLSTQTDLNTALSGKVPTTRTLTINGTTQDLSADRTFTISTGITIGTTAITSGTVGRVLFEGTGNVVQESAGLTYNDTTKAFTLSGNQNASTSLTISNTTSGTSAQIALLFNANTGIYKYSASTTAYKIFNANDFGHYNSAAGDISILNDFNTGKIKFSAGGSSTAQMTITSAGNVLINTTTDAGFKLDVNGTARVSGLITAGGGLTWGSSPSDSSLSNGAAGTNAINISRRGISLSNGADNGILLDGGNGASSISRIYIGGGSGTQPLCLNGNARETVFGSDTATSNASSLVRMVSTTKGFLPPVMTTTQKNAIASPSAGLMVYDTTLNLISVYNGTTWISL